MSQLNRLMKKKVVKQIIQKKKKRDFTVGLKGKVVDGLIVTHVKRTQKLAEKNVNLVEEKKVKIEIIQHVDQHQHHVVQKVKVKNGVKKVMNLLIIQKKVVYLQMN